MADLVTDYQGKTYDPAVILSLSKQIAAAVDPKAIKGGVFSTKGESVGFNYDEATKLLGREPNAAEQVFLDMARHLAKEGVTDLKNADLSETNRRFGSTYTGGGGTIYEIKKDASGNPVISTWSKSTSDKGTILGALALAGLAFGVYSLLGEAAAATTGLTASELAMADMALGGVGGTAGATALAEAAAAGAGLTGASALGADTGGLLTGGTESAVTGMGGGTGLTAGSSGLGINAGVTGGLGATGGGAGITAGTGLAGTGVLTGSTLGTSLVPAGTTLAGLTNTGLLSGSNLGVDLLGTTGTESLTGTGILTGSDLGTTLIGTGPTTAVTTGGVSGLTPVTNLGPGALNTGVTTGTVPTVTPTTPTVAPTTPVTPTTPVSPTTGLLSGLTTQQLAGLIAGGLGTVGGLMQQQTSKEAAEAAQKRIDEETAAAKLAAQFRPVGMTTRFGTSNFTYNPTTGQMESAGYTLSPEAKAQQDRLMALSEQGLTQAEQAQSLYAPLQTGAQSLFNLGNKYLAQTPEEVAQRYMTQQMNLLQPGRELELANLQNKLMQQGRSGLAVAQGGSYGATTPELQALFNARAAQEAKLAADAELAGQQQVTFGAGLLTKGAGAMGEYYSGQEKAYAPYTMASTKAQGLETLAERPLSLSTQIGQMSTNAGVNAANFGLKGAELATKMATSPAATTNPYSTILAGLSDPNSTISQGIADYIKKNWG